MSPPTDTIGAQLRKMVSTVTENCKGYTQRQFENEKIAKCLYNIVVFPMVESFKHIIRKNTIRNCPVTINDVSISKKIYGADIGALKVKTTLNRTKPLKNDLVEVTP